MRSGGGGPRSRSPCRCRAARKPPRAARARRRRARAARPRASPSNISSESAATRPTCSGSLLKRWARFSTDSRRTSSNSSRSPSSRSKKTPSRRPASVTSMRVEAAAVERGGEHERAAQDHVAAVWLDAAQLTALRGRASGEQLDQLLERVTVERKALHVGERQLGAPHRGYGEVADRPADPDQAAALPPPAERPQLRLHALAQRLQCLGRRLLPGQELLADPHRAERQRVGLAPAADLRAA